MYAWVTSVLEEGQVDKALCLGGSLKRVRTALKLVVVTVPGLEMSLRDKLSAVFDLVVDLQGSSSDPLEKLEALARIQALSLFVFKKCVYIPPTAVVMRNCDEIIDHGNNFAVTESQDKKDFSVFLFTPSKNLYQALKTIRTETGNWATSFEQMMENNAESWKILNESYNTRVSLKSSNLEANPLNPAVINFVDVHPLNSHENFLIGEDFQQSFQEIAANYCRTIFTEDIQQANLTQNYCGLINDNEPIAIVGLSFRLPGGNTPDEFWNFLIERKNAVQRVPGHRWTREHSMVHWKDRSIEAGFLDIPVDEFDAKFFGISTKDATLLDPQQRLLHEVAWESLEDAGIDPLSLHGSQTGIFTGSWVHNYNDIAKKCTNPDFFRTYMGNSIAASSARLSHFFGTTGPSIATESGCSSAIVAVDLAVKALRNRDTSLALACGVNLILHPFDSALLQGVLAPDYRCKTFDASANGFARAEGCAILVMKRLSGAVKDGDKIWGLIRGSAVTQEGLSKSLGTPTIHSESLAMRLALQDGGVDPRDVDYIETHGTGTAVGDPLEVAAINKAYYSKGRSNPLVIGSVKTNVGHTESVSGITGIIKVLLSMKHGKIPPHINFQELNPAIELDRVPLHIPVTAVDWVRVASGKPRIGGVSSFGISGTDGHCIVEEAPVIPSCPLTSGKLLERPLHILKLSAKCKESFDVLVDKYAHLMENCPPSQFANYAYSANTGRSTFNHRAVIIAREGREAGKMLKERSFRSGEYQQGSSKLCFLFTGQGSQYPGMAQELYTTSPVFRAHFEVCEKILWRRYNIPIREVLWGRESHNLERTLYSQTTIFCVEYCLLKLWASWGVKPDFVLGHSLGEFCAAVAAGALNFEDGLMLVAERSRLIDALPGGKMLVIKAPRKVVDQTILKYQEDHHAGFWADYAALNSPEQSVICGDSQMMEEFAKFCEAKSLKAVILAATHAFHSRHMDPMLDAYGKIASTVKGPRREEDHLPKYVSGMDGKLVDVEDIDANYWVRHTREKVSFMEACKVVQSEGCNLFVEVGPHPVLSALTMMNMEGTSSVSCLPSIRRKEDNWLTLLDSLGKLYCSSWRGSLDWKGFDLGYSRTRLELPFYPFNRKSIWVEIRPDLPTLHPLLGKMLPSASSHFVYENEVTLKGVPFAQDHVIGNTVVFPGAGFLEMCLAAGYSSAQGFTEEISKPRRAIALKDLKIAAPLAINESMDVVQTIVKLEENNDSEQGGYDVTVFRQDSHRSGGGGDWISHASAKFLPVLSSSTNYLLPGDIDISKIQSTWEHSDNRSFYDRLPDVGLRFGPKFQSLESGWRGDSGGILLSVKVPEDHDAYLLHPVIGDAMIQAAMLWTSSRDNVRRKLQVPVSIGEFIWLNWSSSGKRFIYVSEDGKKGSVSCNLLDEEGTPLAFMGAVEFLETTATLVEGMIKQQSVAMPKLWEEVWKSSPGPLQNELDPVGTPVLLNGDPLHQQLAQYNERSEAENEFHDQLSHATRLFMMSALLGSGWSPERNKMFTVEELSSELGLCHKYQNYIGFFLRSMASQVMLGMEKEEEGKSTFYWFPQEPPTLPEISAQLECSHGKKVNMSRLEYRLVVEVGKKLQAIIQGKTDPLSILFPGDPSKPDAGGFYEELSCWMVNICHQINEKSVFPKVRQRVEDFKVQGKPGKPLLRLLEVGSGTGVFTRMLLTVLNKSDIDYEYYYTDISAAFFAAAEAEFGGEGRRFVFKKLNMEEDPLGQGYPPEYFDILLACEVLHVSKDVKQTLRRLRSLVKPGGHCQIIEDISQDVAITFIFGLLEGYWRFEDFELRPNHPTLSPQGWRTALEASGWESVVCCPSYNNRLGMITAMAASENNVKGILRTVGSSKWNWVIFDDGGALAEELEGRLSEVNRTVRRVKRPGLNNRKCEEKMRGLMKDLMEEREVEGIIYLWGLAGDRASSDQVDISLPFVTLCQVVVELEHVPNVFVVTQGVFSVEGSLVGDPSAGTLVGLVRAMNNENLLLNLNHFDLSPELEAGNQVDEVFANLWVNVNEGLTFRGGNRYGVKLTAGKVPNHYLTLPNGCDRFQLALPSSRQISDLEFTFLDHYALEEDEIEVEVKAMALNFRDVFTVLKPIAEFETFHAVGLDFAGVVSKVGANVQDKKVGDRVMGMRLERETPLPSHVRVKESMALPLPRNITFTEGATIPTVFSTVYYSLVMMAKMRKGETVLVHTASGGVGLCVIQFAKLIGANIIATAGSPRKRTVLKKMGIKHVFNSRNTEFGREVMEVTKGRGVDVVLNSLTGPGFKEVSMAALAQNGRFIELAALNIWSPEEVQELRPDVFYHVVDFKSMPLSALREMRNAFYDYLSKDLIKPITYERFDALNIRGALNYLQKAKHIGKIVCVMPEVKADKKKYFARTPMFNEESTYLVTGGLGGIGFEMVKWILGSGGKHVVIASRSSPKPETASQIESWNKNGKHVEAFQIDVGSLVQCKELFDKISHPDSSFPPLRGVLHAAGVLADAIIQNQTWDKFLHTYNPKVEGSWNLHELTKNLLLEHFVLFSSMSATFGTPGQTNHSSANSFEDTLATYRHSIGLPATSVNWANWGEVGVATEIDFPGFRPIPTSQGILAIEMFLRTQKRSCAVANIDSFSLAAKLFPRVKNILDDKRFLGDSQTHFIINSDEFWALFDKAAGREEKVDLFQTLIKTTMKNILKCDRDEVIDSHAEFASLGVDSLMMLEMKNGLQNIFGQRVTLTAAHLKDCNTVDVLANRLVSILEGEDISQNPENLPTLEELKELVREDSMLPEHIRPQEGSREKNVSKVESILLTGATGNLGRYMLSELSRRNSISKIYCLMRKSKDGLSKLKSRLQGVKLLEHVDLGKVQIIEGDICRPRLGLSEDAYDKLGAGVNAIVHCAVKAAHNEKYWKSPESVDSIRTANVFGTRNILEFAVHKELKHVYHASTLLLMTTCGDNGCINDSWQDVGTFDDFNFNLGYPLSKHIAEQLLEQAVGRGIPCKVFRLPLIGGDSCSGRCDWKSSHFLMRCLATMKLGCMPDTPLPLSMMAVDHCASKTLQMFFSEAAPPDVYNVIHRQPDMEQVLGLVAQEEFGVDVKAVSYEEFAERVKAEDDNSPLAPFRKFYEDEAMMKWATCPQQVSGAAESYLNYVVNMDQFFTSPKLDKYFPQLQAELEPVHQVVRRDLRYLKEEGVFRLFGIEG